MLVVPTTTLNLLGFGFKLFPLSLSLTPNSVFSHIFLKCRRLSFFHILVDVFDKSILSHSASKTPWQNEKPRRESFFLFTSAYFDPSLAFESLLFLDLEKV